MATSHTLAEGSPWLKISHPRAAGVLLASQVPRLINRDRHFTCYPLLFSSSAWVMSSELGCTYCHVTIYFENQGQWDRKIQISPSDTMPTPTPLHCLFLNFFLKQNAAFASIWGLDIPGSSHHFRHSFLMSSQAHTHSDSSSKTGSPIISGSH